MTAQAFDELISDCLVQVRREDADEGFGTGFFVADRTVLTCAHVVHGLDLVNMVWRGRKLAGRVVTRLPEQPGDGQFHQTPDLAVIELDELVEHSSAWLVDPVERLADGAIVQVHGFSKNTVHAPEIAKDVCQLTVAGLLEDDCLRVIHDRIPRGMSGSLVLDAGSRRVCGVMKASVDDGGVLAAGGWIVSVGALARCRPDVIEANKQACSAWREATDPGLRYLTEMFAKDDPWTIEVEGDRLPSYYLDPRRQVARFLHRPELDELESWCLRNTAGVVRLVYGPGGAGKTRLSVQLIERMKAQGWIAGRLANRAEVDLDQLAQALVGRKVLLCIDYAEDWAYALPELLTKLVATDHRQLRILLLARTVGAWWKTLRTARHVKSIVKPDPTPLGQLGEQIDRSTILRHAYQDFRAAIWTGAPEETPSVLIDAAPGEANVLGLHAAALAVVLYARDNDGCAPEHTVDLRHPLGDLLDHERNWWQSWIQSPGIVLEQVVWERLDLVDFSSRVLLVAALYLAADAAQAEVALAGVLTEGGFPAGLASKIVATLTKVYPNTRPDVRRHWDPLQPDRLSETLVLEILGEADSKERCIDLVSEIFAGGVNEMQAEQSLIVLSRASGLAAPSDVVRSAADTAMARQRAVDCIRALLEQFPDTFLPAATTVAAGLSEPTPLIDVIRSTLQHAHGDVPRRAVRHIPRTIPSLASLESALWQRCIELSVEQSKSFTVTQEFDLASQYRWLSDAQERTGEVSAALTAVRSAVEWFEHVVLRGRDDAIVDLVDARDVLADRELQGGNDGEALEQITRAIDTYQDLVDDDQPYQGELVRARGFKSRLLRKMGRHKEADEEERGSREQASEYKQFVAEWLASIMPQPVDRSGEDDSAESALDRYSGPRPSYDDPELQLVIPVGHFAGPMYTAMDAEFPESFEIRFRDGVFSLSVEEYVVWAVSHGDPNLVGTIPNTREGVEYAAREMGVEEPAPVFESLVDDGLLVEFPPAGETEAAREFARRHQLIPLALGLGNSSEYPAEFKIGLPNAPRVSVGYDVYHMWLFVHRATSLWDAISAIAQEAIDANAEDDGPNAVKLIEDPDMLLTALLRALPPLISTSCIFLDRR